MTFLSREFEGLPDDLVAALLKQLEETIRHADATIRYTASGEVPRMDLQCIALCGRLSSVLNLAQKLKAELRSKDNEPTNS